MPCEIYDIMDEDRCTDGTGGTSPRYPLRLSTVGVPVHEIRGSQCVPFRYSKVRTGGRLGVFVWPLGYT